MLNNVIAEADLGKMLSQAGEIAIFLPILAVAVAVILLLHWLVKNRSPIIKFPIYLVNVLIINSVITLHGAVTGRNQTILFEYIIVNIIPFLYFGLSKKLKSIDRKIVGLSDPLRAIIADTKLGVPARKALYEIADYFYTHSENINRISSEPGAEQKAFGKIYINVLLEKSKAAIDQATVRRVFLRYHLFMKVWPQLTKASTDYISVCDLSPFKDIWNKDLHDTLADWRLRLSSEVPHLLSLGGVRRARRFDKIIVYQARTMRSGTEEKPSCIESGLCAGAKCQTDCVVREVTRRWSLSGVKSRFGSHSNNGGTGNIWLVERDKLAEIFSSVNGGGHWLDGDGVTSLDIGLFGRNLVGEEFKLLGQPFRYFGGVGDREQPSTTDVPERPIPFDYMYTLRDHPELHRALHYHIVEALNERKYLTCVA